MIQKIGKQAAMAQKRVEIIDIVWKVNVYRLQIYR
jgi:hypothetical protein